MKRSDMTSKDRKDRPIFSGVLKYFPDALLEVAELSRIANEKHNPGEPLHWSKGKSNDHGDALVRHQLDAGSWDDLEGHRVRHSAEVAWRALAQLQTEIENEQALAEGQLLEDREEQSAVAAVADQLAQGSVTGWPAATTATPASDCERTGGEWRNGNCYTKTQFFEGTPFRPEPKGLAKDDCLRAGYVWGNLSGCRKSL